MHGGESVLIFEKMHMYLKDLADRAMFDPSMQSCDAASFKNLGGYDPHYARHEAALTACFERNRGIAPRSEITLREVVSLALPSASHGR
jgi:hypothetical protein